ncbi:DNA-protecting protein DprA [Candidatus Uhrbacteria bacterium]|nr:DNA-protecting protein DprA [Candidatus Uhrbacteria bacterium]
MDQEKIYTIAFSHIPAVGPVSFARLTAHFPTLYEAWHATRDEYVCAKISNAAIGHIASERSKIDIEAILAKLTQERINVVTAQDDVYPELLRKIYDPPYVLYYRGTLPEKDRTLFGVIGARKATPYGLQCTHRLVPDLSTHGIGIVSGLAYGIDAASHEAALAHSGYTLAVIAGGVDHASIYPSVHRNLADRIIASGGCVLSEYPPATQPLPRQFPLRNRIIAGISQGVLVVEAAEKSGALITATCALENGREVCAVPGPITSPFSSGTNRLIKSGAHAITQSADILSILGFDLSSDGIASSAIPTLTDAERILYDVLSREPMHLDDLIKESRLDTQVVASTLLMLEMKNLIRSYDRMQYSRI